METDWKGDNLLDVFKATNDMQNIYEIKFEK